jgi:hypothetical protein
MSAGASLAFPGGRTLAAWWRQLAPYHPQAFWLGYLTFHRLEALVGCQRRHRLPPFELLVLKALAIHAPNGDTLPVSALAADLHFDAPVLHQVVRRLDREGLTAAGGAGSTGLTAAGRQALEHGDYLRPQL